MLSHLVMGSIPLCPSSLLSFVLDCHPISEVTGIKEYDKACLLSSPSFWIAIKAGDKVTLTVKHDTVKTLANKSSAISLFQLQETIPVLFVHDCPQMCEDCDLLLQNDDTDATDLVCVCMCFVCMYVHVCVLCVCLCVCAYDVCMCV